MRVQTGWIALSGVLWALPASAQMFGGPDENWHQDWGWGHMILGSLMMVIFWGMVIAVIVFGVRWMIGSSSRNMPSPSENNPLDILKQRFARGEIDREEFEDRKQLLSD